MYDQAGYEYWTQQAAFMQEEVDACLARGFHTMAEKLSVIVAKYTLEAESCAKGPEPVFRCDNCDAITPTKSRWVAVAPDGAGMPTEVMWMCPKCGKEHNLTPSYA